MKRITSADANGHLAEPADRKDAADDEREECIACEKAFVEGVPYYADVSGGFIHADCCGPERDGYVGADGEPLKPGEPIPEPAIWTEGYIPLWRRA